MSAAFATGAVLALLLVAYAASAGVVCAALHKLWVKPGLSVYDKRDIGDVCWLFGLTWPLSLPLYLLASIVRGVAKLMGVGR